MKNSLKPTGVEYTQSIIDVAFSRYASSKSHIISVSILSPEYLYLWSAFYVSGIINRRQSFQLI